MVRVSGKIRRLLIDAGLVSSDDWASARATGQPVVDVLLERGGLDEGRLYEILGEASGFPPLDLTRVKPSRDAVEALPPETCLEHCVLPIAMAGNTLTVAVSDPFDVLLLDDLNILTRCRVRPVVSHPAAIRSAISLLFNTGQARGSGSPRRGEQRRHHDRRGREHRDQRHRWRRCSRGQARELDALAWAARQG